MITQNTWVRDTLIKVDILQTLPADRQAAINKLYDEFKNSGYIDARTEIGPDQYARMSQKRRDQISATACQVFRIEQKIKELMKSDEQLAKEAELKAEQKKRDRIQYLRNRATQLMTFCQKKLFSDRMNGTKREWEEIQTELKTLV